MVFKKSVLVLGLAAVVSGCGTPGKSGVQPEDLRKPRYFVTETLIGDMDFPTLQRNLYKHRDACGSAPRFVMDEGQTSYASLIETSEVPQSYENVVVADLTQYPDSWRSPKRVEIQVYSYYNNSDVQKRVARMLAAVRQPGQCAD